MKSLLMSPIEIDCKYVHPFFSMPGRVCVLLWLVDDGDANSADIPSVFESVLRVFMRRSMRGNSHVFVL